MQSADFSETARQIRLRIFKLVMRAFVGVLLIILVLVLIVTGLVLNYNVELLPLNQIPQMARLEGYYLGHGSWEGVQSVFNTDNISSHRAPTLLDREGKVVLDYGSKDSERVGSAYVSTGKDLFLPMYLRGERIGTLVLDQKSAPSRTIAVAGLLLPVGVVSIFLALMATAISLLLSRRIVNPLADVIAASRAVTRGRLDTRVEVRGPHDFRALSDSFNQMATTLERNDRERRDMLADIAHELRTPISAIRGRLEGIQDGIYPADPEHISLALKSTYMLEHLVEDLRLLTLAESRQLPFEKKATGLAALAGRVVEVFSAEAQEKDIALFVQPPEQEINVLVDAQRTEQVIGNLVSNALRYVPPGGQVWITIEACGAAGGPRLAVNDSGPGIPEADLPYIFNRFWRKDRSRARQSGGSGLGLAIARQMVEAQGGQITARNRPEGGLEVQIAFPQ